MKILFGEKMSMYFPAPTTELSDGCVCVAGRVASSVSNDKWLFPGDTANGNLAVRQYVWENVAGMAVRLKKIIWSKVNIS